MSDADLVSLTTAIGMLRNRDGRVHTFRGGGAFLLGADWNYDDIVDALRHAPRIEVTGPAAQALGHGLVIDKDGLLFIETKPALEASADGVRDGVNGEQGPWTSN